MTAVGSTVADTTMPMLDPDYDDIPEDPPDDDDDDRDHPSLTAAERNPSLK